MRLKIFLSIFGTIGLVVLLFTSIYVAQQNQDIRQRAVNDFEFMQVTPAQRVKRGRAQVGVILNKLDPKFEYRLLFNLKYEDSGENPKGENRRYPDLKKTTRVKENKTYKFTFRADNCKYIAKLDIQLYYRETRRTWKKVDAPTAVGNTKMDIDCLQKWPTPPPTVATPAPTTAETSDSSDSANLTPTPPPVVETQPSPSPELETPPEEGLNEPDPEAPEIENLEDQNVIEQENQQAQSGSPAPSTTAQSNPSPSAAVQTTNPSPSTELTLNALSPTPSPIVTSQPSPTPTANQETTNPTPTPDSSNQTGGSNTTINNNSTTNNSSSTTTTQTTITTAPGGFGMLLNANTTPPTSSTNQSTIAIELPHVSPLIIEPSPQEIAFGSGAGKTIVSSGNTNAIPVAEKPKEENGFLNWLLVGGAVVFGGLGILLLL